MNATISPYISAARLVMETMAELHKMGYGKLKLYSYFSSLRAWRHFIFASDSLPSSIGNIPNPMLHGSIPWLSTPTISGLTKEQAALNFIKKNPELAEAGKGLDQFYVEWYSWILSFSNVDSVLIMENERVATIGRHLYSRLDFASKNTEKDIDSTLDCFTYALTLPQEHFIEKYDRAVEYSQIFVAPVGITPRLERVKRKQKQKERLVLLSEKARTIFDNCKFDDIFCYPEYD